MGRWKFWGCERRRRRREGIRKFCTSALALVFYAHTLPEGVGGGEEEEEGETRAANSRKEGVMVFANPPPSPTPRVISIEEA